MHKSYAVCQQSEAPKVVTKCRQYTVCLTALLTIFQVMKSSSGSSGGGGGCRTTHIACMPVVKGGRVHS